MSFARVLGQESAVRRLKDLAASRKLPPALLFLGPDGVGKSLAAVELAKALNCERTPYEDGCAPALPRASVTEPSGEGMPPPGVVGGRPASEGLGGAADSCDSCAAAAKGLDPDLKRVDAAYQAGLLGEGVEKQRAVKVDTVRHLIKDMEMKSLGGRWKVAVLEDAHRLVEEAANALLKALEEPPPRALWILVCARRERLPPTILSRCHAVTFRALATGALEAVLAAQGVPKQEAARLAALSEGSVGRALELRARPRTQPASWTCDPLGPFRLADALPKELHLSRPLAVEHLSAMAWHVRLGGSLAGATGAGPRRALRELAALRSALDSNADPRLVVTLAGLELQRLTIKP